ncbi:MAG: DNA polymerase III subunit beta [Roseiflexus sp.]|nr:DNA polymerase III subunit beta [Roseiflexus sp.]
MHLSCAQELLKRGLAMVGPAVAGKSTLPILSHVRLACDDGRLNLAATNLDIGITCWIDADVKRAGAIAAPARLLTDVVTSLPNDHIDLTLDERTQTLCVRCARFETNIRGIDAGEFPTMPSIDDCAPVVVFPSKALREAIQQVAFAASDEETHPILQGVQLRLRDQSAIFAAADGFRLARKILPLPGSAPQLRDVIIPARTLQHLARMLASDDEPVALIVTPSGGQAIFRTSAFELASRMIDGAFPNIDAIIPQQFWTRAVLDTQEMMKAVKLASYVAVAASYVVRVHVEPGDAMSPRCVTISANAAEVGDHTGRIDATIQGESGQVALNVTFLSEAIAAMPTPQMALELRSPQDPVTLKPVGADGLVYLLMPMLVRA